MKFGIKNRLMALVLAVAVMGVLILLATLYSQRQAEKLRDRLGQVESESFSIAEQFRESLRALNNTMQSYATDHDPAVWNEFLEASRKLDGWIEEQKPKLTTQHEKEALQKMNAEYKEYLQVARDLQVKVQSLGGQSVSLADFNPLAGAVPESFRSGAESWEGALRFAQPAARPG